MEILLKNPMLKQHGEIYSEEVILSKNNLLWKIWKYLRQNIINLDFEPQLKDFSIFSVLSKLEFKAVFASSIGGRGTL